MYFRQTLAAKQAVKPGVRFCDIDEAARRVIREVMAVMVNILFIALVMVSV